jgi:ubiquinone/menaquinone biosynthesis C-methylase UbiE
MSSLVFMKLLETRASRYDLGMRMISLGRIARLYEAVASAVPPGCAVLDAGCGTGGVTAELLRRGCTVTGVDRSDAMLKVAEQKLHASIADGRLRLRQLNLVRLSAEFPEPSFDAAVCCLVFSELSRTEQRYVLQELGRVVRPGGTVVVADEISPRSAPARLAHRAGRAPLAALTYLLTQTGTRPVPDLGAAMTASGLEAVAATTPASSFGIATGRRPVCRLAPRR